MATKNISITEEAYRRLAALRKKNESFSEIIIEITGKRAKLSDFHGILSKESGDILVRNIRDARELTKKVYEDKIKKEKKEVS